MKKMICAVLALAMMACLFAGCGASKDDNVLKVAISPDFAPMEFVIYNEKGEAEYAGFDVMLAEYIAQELGMELRSCPWTSAHARPQFPPALWICPSPASAGLKTVPPTTICLTTTTLAITKPSRF